MENKIKVLRHIRNMMLKIKSMSIRSPNEDDLLYEAFCRVPDDTTIELYGQVVNAKQLFDRLDNNSEKERLEIYRQFFDPFILELDKVRSEYKQNVISSLAETKDASNSEDEIEPKEAGNNVKSRLESQTSIHSSPHSSTVPKLNSNAIYEKRILENGNRRYILKNGKVGQKYLDELDLNQYIEEGRIVNATIENLELIGGLEFNTEKLSISGTPQNSGKQELNYEFHLKVRYERPDGEKDAREIVLKVFPDPKSLWKTLEPDESISDRKPHEDKIKVSTGIRREDGSVLSVVAGSKRGRSHAHEGTFRDDHFATSSNIDSDWLIIAVADGAGSSSFSRTGSKIACENSVSFITETLMLKNEELISAISQANPEEKQVKSILYSILSGAAFDSAKKIEEEAKNRSLKVRDFYTTLLLLIVKRVDKRYFIAGLGIGDGAICIKMNNKNIELLNKPDGGDFGGQTRFLTMPEVLTAEELYERSRFTLVDDFECVFIMTDGVSDPKFETDNNLINPEFWERFFGELKVENIIPIGDGSEDRLLKWLDFWSEGNHDDRTLVIVQ